MKTILTKEGKLKLEEELNILTTIERSRIINDLSESRDSGSLEENTQYLIAKDEYEKLQKKIQKIKSMLSDVIVVSSDNVKTDKVSVLTNVKVLNMNSNKEMTFKIVPESEIDIKNSKISTNSPIGSSLFGKSIDEICEIKIPSGILKFKILEISI
jgi:transcription elongation factor GreA